MSKGKLEIRIKTLGGAYWETVQPQAGQESVSSSGMSANSLSMVLPPFL